MNGLFWFISIGLANFFLIFLRMGRMCLQQSRLWRVSRRYHSAWKTLSTSSTRVKNLRLNMEEGHGSQHYSVSLKKSQCSKSIAWRKEVGAVEREKGKGSWAFDWIISRMYWNNKLGLYQGNLITYKKVWLLKNINWKDRFPKAGDKLIQRSQDLWWLLPKLLHKIRVHLLERKCLHQNIPLI